MKCAVEMCSKRAVYFAIWKNVLTVLCYFCAGDAQQAGHRVRRFCL